MKKYFPILLSILVFSAFLTGQILFNSGDSSAKQSTIVKKVHKHYESIYKGLEVKAIDGKKYKMTDVKAPIVIVNFWASWCIPCLEEFDSLMKLKRTYPDDRVMVFGINTDDEEQLKKIKKTLKKYPLNFPVVKDDKSKITDAFNVSAIPVSITFKNGKVIEVSNGAKDFGSVEYLRQVREWF